MFRKFQQQATSSLALVPSWVQKTTQMKTKSPNPLQSSQTNIHPTTTPFSPLYTVSTTLASMGVGLTAYHLYHQPSNSLPPHFSPSPPSPILPLPHPFSPTTLSNPAESIPSSLSNFFHNKTSNRNTSLYSPVEAETGLQSTSLQSTPQNPTSPSPYEIDTLIENIVNPFEPEQVVPSTIPPLNRIDSRYLDMTSFLIFSLVGLLGVRVLLYPLNVLKTRLQATTPVPSPNPLSMSVSEQSIAEQQSPAIQQKRLSAKVVLMDIVRNEGIAPLFAGLGLSLGLTASRQLYFYMYEHLRSAMVQFNLEHKMIESESVFNLSKDSIAAFVATALYQIVANPLDIIVQRLMTHRRAVEKVSNLHMVEEATALKAEQMANTFDPFAVSEAPKSKSNLTQALSDRFAAVRLTRNLFYADPAVFYRGFASSTVLWSFNSMIWWGSFEMLLQQFARFFPQSSVENSQTVHFFDGFLCDDSQQLLHTHGWYAQHVAAAVSSWLSVVLTHPLDTARTRLMVNCRKDDGMTATSAILNTIRQEGFKGLWCGLTARILLVVPTSVLTMSVYQVSKVFSVEMQFRNGKLQRKNIPSDEEIGYQYFPDQVTDSPFKSEHFDIRSLVHLPQLDSLTHPEVHHHHHHHHHHHSHLQQQQQQKAHPLTSQLQGPLQRGPNGEYYLEQKQQEVQIPYPPAPILPSSSNPLVALIANALTGQTQHPNPVSQQFKNNLSQLPHLQLQRKPTISVSSPNGPVHGEQALQLPHYIEFRLISKPTSQTNPLLLDMSLPPSLSNPSSIPSSVAVNTVKQTPTEIISTEDQTRQVMNLFQQIHDLVGKLGYHIEVLDAGDGEPDSSEENEANETVLVENQNQVVSH